METDSREARTEALPAAVIQGATADARENLREEAAFWFTGGASLLLWTAFALLLTSA